MAQTRLIKSRIKSATNIAKITKAMEMVSASKMRRSQDQALASRPYTHKLIEMLHTIASHTDASLHPLLQKNEHSSAPELIVLISTDRGLAGALNSNLFRATVAHIASYKNPVFITVGKKAREFVLKLGRPLIAEFTALPDQIGLADVLPITEVFVRGYLQGEFSRVDTLHMQFVSTLTQKPEINHILPVAPDEIKTTHKTEVSGEYTFEPSPKEILGYLLPFYVENGFYQVMLEAKASEHSARMVAMKNASDNAKEIVGSLRLEYNKSRQASITAELLDITTAALTVS